MKRPRAVKLNELATYYVGTGCVRIGNATIELSVLEEEMFEILLRTPSITVQWERLESETCRANQTIRHTVRGLRDKLGHRCIRTHVGKGVSLRPQFVGTERARLQTVRRVS